MKIKQQAIAERLGISVSTVSLALRDIPQVAEETRHQVRALAEELGYQLPVRRALRTPQSSQVKQIAVLTRFELTNPFYSAVLHGTESECRKHHIALRYSMLEELTPRALKQFRDSDALLLLGPIDEDSIVQLHQLELPMVLVDNNLPHLGLDRVLTENNGSVRRAMTHLVEWGHRRIAFAYCCPGDPSMEERRSGYQWAIARYGLPLIEIPYTWPGAETPLPVAVTRWLQTPEAHEVTAIMTYNDESAINLIHTLQDQGVRVPEDISVVGFDDIESACIVRPALTTCHVERVTMGERGVQTLLNRVAHPEAPVMALVQDTTFVERGSSQRLHTSSTA